MSKLPVIMKLEKKQLKNSIPNFRVGDTIKVHQRIIEGNKERIQVFMGTVIARKGSGISETVSLHRVAYGEGMERVFVLHSPRIARIELVKRGKVRRSKLYYLRGTTGKAARIKGQVAVSASEAAAAEEIPAEETNTPERSGETAPVADESAVSAKE